MLFISIVGNIGSGKSTISRYFEKAGYMHIAEPVDENPYLERFYANKSRWCLSMEMDLQLAYHNAIKAAREQAPEFLVMDWGLPVVYVMNAYVREKLLIKYEYDTFQRLMRFLNTPIPDITFYLDVTPEECLRRIKERNRECEQDIDLNYLKNLDESYRNYLENFTGRVFFIKNETEAERLTEILRFMSQILIPYVNGGTVTNIVTYNDSGITSATIESDTTNK